MSVQLHFDENQKLESVHVGLSFPPLSVAAQNFMTTMLKPGDLSAEDLKSLLAQVSGFSKGDSDHLAVLLANQMDQAAINRRRQEMVAAAGRLF
jgi:hypothetical protein